MPSENYSYSLRRLHGILGPCALAVNQYFMEQIFEAQNLCPSILQKSGAIIVSRWGRRAGA